MSFSSLDAPRLRAPSPPARRGLLWRMIVWSALGFALGFAVLGWWFTTATEAALDAELVGTRAGFARHVQATRGEFEAEQRRAEAQFEAELRRRLVSEATMIAVSLEPYARVLRSLARFTEESPAYGHLDAFLRRQLGGAKARRLVVTDPQGRAIFDTSGRLPSGTVDPRVESASERFAAAAGGTVGVARRNDERGTTTHSGLAPVFDPVAPAETPRVVAVVLVDVEPDSDEALRRRRFEHERALSALAARQQAELSALKRHFDALAEDGRARIVIAGLLGALLAALISVAVSRSVTTPVRALAEAMQRGGADELPPTVAVTRADEIGELTAIFNRLVASLRDAEDEKRRRMEEKLAHSERLAAIGRFSAGLAHELRNPLGAMAGFAQILARKNPTPETRDLVARMQREIEALNRLVAQVLAYGKPSGQAVAVIDLAALIAAQVGLVLAQDDPDRPDIEVALDPATPPVLARYDDARRVLLNVLQNAVEARPATGPVRVETRVDERVVTVLVRDQGPGIPQELRARIFEPFFTTRAQGTGLGLALAHALMEAGGGAIEVEDGPPPGLSACEAPAGACLALRFPRAEPSAAKG